MHLISSLLSLLSFDCITFSAYIRNLIHNAVVLGAMERRLNGKKVMKTQSQEENTTATNGVGSVTGFFFLAFCLTLLPICFLSLTLLGG